MVTSADFEAAQAGIAAARARLAAATAALAELSDDLELVLAYVRDHPDDEDAPVRATD